MLIVMNAVVLVHHSVEALEKFANDLLDGKLEAYLKSEAIPEESDEKVKVCARDLT